MSTLFFRKVVPVPIWEVRLKFSKIVFTLAGIWGIVVTVPLYFLFDIIGRQSPPAINHPEFYYSFAGVTLAWQLVFLLIGTNVQRYRMMMAPAIVRARRGPNTKRYRTFWPSWPYFSARSYQ